jgi:hypothetical protein
LPLPDGATGPVGEVRAPPVHAIPLHVADLVICNQGPVKVNLIAIKDIKVVETAKKEKTIYKVN